MKERILVLESTVAIKPHHIDILLEKFDDVNSVQAVLINGIGGKLVKAEDVFDECYNDLGRPFDRIK